MEFDRDTNMAIRLVQAFGPLQKNQIVRFVEAQSARPDNVRKFILPGVIHRRQLFYVRGSYIGRFRDEQIDEKMVYAFWVFLKFADKVKDTDFRQASYPSQIWFFRDGVEHFITVVSPGTEYEVNLIQRDIDAKYVFAVHDTKSAERLLRYLENFPTDNVRIAVMEADEAANEPKITWKKLKKE